MWWWQGQVRAQVMHRFWEQSRWYTRQENTRGIWGGEYTREGNYTQAHVGNTILIQVQVTRGWARDKIETARQYDLVYIMGTGK